MSVPKIPEDLTQLKAFLEYFKFDPYWLHQPNFAFIKSFIEHFGGKIPEYKPSDSAESKNETETKAEEPKFEAEVLSDESDLELDMTGVIEPDNDPPQKMGNPTLQPTEEEITESQAKRSEAVSAFVEKDYEKAIQLYTEAIVLNPQASLLYAKRGQVYLLLQKPNACIRDCNRALELNPDSAAAHKFRGRAYHLLGKWEEAANDLRLACKFDFDEQADEWLREATPNARKIQEHKRKKERKLEEERENAKQDSASNAKEAPADSKEQQDKSTFYKFLNDQDILKAFQDPEIVESIQNISNNPLSCSTALKNPKMAAFVETVSRKLNINESSFPGLFGANPPPQTNPANTTESMDNVSLD